jgi:hypothetical protein
MSLFFLLERLIRHASLCTGTNTVYAAECLLHVNKLDTKEMAPHSTGLGRLYPPRLATVRAGT